MCIISETFIKKIQVIKKKQSFKNLVPTTKDHKTAQINRISFVLPGAINNFCEKCG